MKISLPGFLITFVLESASRVGAVVAPLLVNRSKIDVEKNVAYGEGDAQILDVYRPKGTAPGASLPVALFIHGGGFRFFSKDSHAAAAARLAESGRVVFCIDYRVTPKNPFPAGLADSAAAYAWLVNQCADYGGDPRKISLIGESSGAGFTVSLCLFLFGLAKFPDGVALPALPTERPKAVVAHCGFYEVSNVDRFAGDRRFHATGYTRVNQIRSLYLPNYRSLSKAERALAEPLQVLAALAEAGAGLPAGYPSFFLPVGALDPVIGDTERLAAVLAKLGQKDRLRVYPGVGHAFYAAPGGVQAKLCWADITDFLGRAGV
jgi:acetyl esterase/lipase